MTETEKAELQKAIDIIQRVIADPVTPPPEPEPTHIISGKLDIVQIGSTGNVRCMSRAQTPDCYLAQSYWEAIQWIADLLPKQFPNRSAKKTEIIRATPFTNPAQEDTHPAGGLVGDFHYFTMGLTNHTQSYSLGEPLIKIWDDKGELTDLFDWDRTLACMEAFRLIFPYFTVSTVPKIKERMGATGRKYDWIGTSLDDPIYHHKTHWHGALTDGIHPVVVNTEAVTL